MTIVVYKCPVCDRTIDIVRNQQGLETVGRCVITDGCRGQLYQLELKANFTRGRFPDAVAGLTDWTQRKILYDHTQAIEEETWLIEHNLGVNPSVQIFVDRESGTETTLEEVEPVSIAIIDENSLTVTLSRAESGVAQCIGRSSKPIIDNVRVEETTTTIQPFQLSGNSELSIATLDDSLTITLVLAFTTPDAREVDLTYVVDDSPSITSPWSDTDNIYFHGKTYVVRSFNGIDNISITDGTVTDSSSWYIKSIDVGAGARTLTSEELIFLLADSPYGEVDKSLETFVDPTPIVAADAAFSFYIENGEFFVYDNLIESVFPPIQSV